MWNPSRPFAFYRYSRIRKILPSADRPRCGLPAGSNQRRASIRLKVLDEAVLLSDLNVPGFNFHRLQGKPVRHSLHVNGPWCVTFEWEGGDAVRVNLEQYH
jgi:proteic killer suppression protein